MNKRTIISAIGCLLWTACAGNAGNSARAAHQSAGEASPQNPQYVEELPLPAVPDSLRVPVERANFVVEHFWDAMEFRDTLRSHSNDFIEQNFANFISIFPIADQNSRTLAVGKLMEAAEVDKESYLLLAEVAEKYLYDPNSPMLNEDFYLEFVDNVLRSKILDNYEKIRYGYQREAIQKNRPGSRAADFAYRTREGKRTNLHSTRTQGDLLLIFFDPECEHCKEIISAMAADPLLEQQIADGAISVLAVYSGENEEQWKASAGELPAAWTVGFDTTGIEERGLYVLRAMPSFYVLDKNKKVVLKDVPPMQFAEYLESL